MEDTNVQKLKDDADAARAEASSLQAEAHRLAAEIRRLEEASNARSAAAFEADATVASTLLKRDIAEAQAEANDLAATALGLEDEARSAASEAKLARERANVAAVHAEAAAKHVAALEAQVQPGNNYIRVEGGSWAEVKIPFGTRDLNVTGVDGAVYNHVSEDASGAWVYRKQTR